MGFGITPEERERMEIEELIVPISRPTRSFDGPL